MPETILKTSAHIITQVDAAGIFVEAATPDPETTIDVAVSAGDSSIGVADEGGAADGDILRIGTGDTMEIGVVASATTGSITLDQPVVYDHAVSEAVVEVSKLDMGHVGEGGVDFSISEDIFEAGAATSAKVLVRKTTRITQGITWPAMEWTTTMLAHAFGIPQSSLTGDGTAATPYRFALDSNVLKTVVGANLYVECTNENGEVIEFQGWGLTPDLNKSWNVSRNSTAELPFGGDVKTIAMLHYL